MRNILNIILLFFLLNTSNLTSAAETEQSINLKTYSWGEAWQKLKSPINYDNSRNTLLAGALLTGALLATSEDTIDPLQENWSTREPLGEWAEVGDIAGQMVPNALYALGMYINHRSTGSAQSRYRSLYMLESSLYSGFTTTVAKVIVGERRPDGSDTKSFPSGHTTTAFAFATAVMVEHEWYYYVPAFALATLVGASRINDNRHHLHDVVAGATVGAVYALSLSKQNKKQKTTQNQHQYIFTPTIQQNKYTLTLTIF